ncbi:mycoredoxin [Bifidobacterium longum]|nr:mycoredoxin [Bifidobacterium longum]
MWVVVLRKKEQDMAIDVYGATWCGDCKQAKNTLEELGTEYTWHDIETEDGAADRAVAISGQQHIPVVLYPDGTFQVEPSAVDIKNKLNELNIK